MARAAPEAVAPSRDIVRAGRYLLSPDSGVFGRGLRFALAGGAVALIYLTTVTVLADGVGVMFQAALAIGFATALTVHFLLQRFFVWVHHDEFALPLRGQLRRYVLLAGTQYGAAAAVTATLPAVLHVSTTICFLVWTVTATALNFVLFGRGVFHAESPVETGAASPGSRRVP